MCPGVWMTRRAERSGSLGDSEVSVIGRVSESERSWTGLPDAVGVKEPGSRRSIRVTNRASGEGRGILWMRGGR